MPISYTIDKAQRQVRTTFTGRVTVDDILDHLEAARKEETLTYTELIDMTAPRFPIAFCGDVLARGQLSAGFAQVKEAFGKCALV